MKIGIIGAGMIGATAAQLLTTAGHEVAISNSRGPETLTEQVRALGPTAQAMTVEDAVRFGEVVLEAIPFGRYRDLPADELRGKILVSISNYYPHRDGTIDEVDGDGALTHSELVARHAHGARVVKAFNSIYWKHLQSQGNTMKPLEQRRVIPLAGDDDEAKEIVAGLIREIGFAPVDLGGLREGGRQIQPGQPLYNRALTLREAKTHLRLE